jgi:hypothetical protein
MSRTRNRRSSSLLGLLWAFGPVKLVAVGVTLAMLGSAAGAGIEGLPEPVRGDHGNHRSSTACGRATPSGPCDRRLVALRLGDGEQLRPM